MPLVVPGVTSQPDSKTEEWSNKLVGKKITDDETSNEISFAKRDLPEAHRVIQPGGIVTKDFIPDRLNVHVRDDGTVSHVTHG
ncbi:putative pua rna binding domain-containing protein [Diaporthe ampelina]|uniref:Putative pua rna binding domain-containing protein n=1 Tax=Diaporthe ampelina TaxID=1214573 RepID=A0A0G2H3N4_9PEZI|nr:putative pua rna binding domain-containing protein [Diaporthe ampelina]